MDRWGRRNRRCAAAGLMPVTRAIHVRLRGSVARWRSLGWCIQLVLSVKDALGMDRAVISSPLLVCADVWRREPVVRLGLLCATRLQAALGVGSLTSNRRARRVVSLQVRRYDHARALPLCYPRR